MLKNRKRVNGIRTVSKSAISGYHPSLSRSEDKTAMLSPLHVCGMHDKHGVIDTGGALEVCRQP